MNHLLTWTPIRIHTNPVACKSCDPMQLCLTGVNSIFSTSLSVSFWNLCSDFLQLFVFCSNRSAHILICQVYLHHVCTPDCQSELKFPSVKSLFPSILTENCLQSVGFRVCARDFNASKLYSKFVYIKNVWWDCHYNSCAPSTVDLKMVYPYRRNWNQATGGSVKNSWLT